MTSLADFTSANGAGRPILLSGGAAGTMDPQILDLDAGDVLVVGSRIVAVGPDLRGKRADFTARVVAL